MIQQLSYYHISEPFHESMLLHVSKIFFKEFSYKRSKYHPKKNTYPSVICDLEDEADFDAGEL